MRGFKSLLSVGVVLVLALCLESEAKAQCNGGYGATNFGGFSTFSAFGGPTFLPYNAGFSSFGVAPVNSFNFFASNGGNGHGNRGFSNRNFNSNGNGGFNSFNFNGGRRGNNSFNVQSSNGGGNGNTSFERFGPFGRVRERFQQSN